MNNSYYDFIECGDSLELMKCIPDKTIDLIVTDPPYEISATNGGGTINKDYPNAIINPLGYWTGGINVDCGCVNRKLGSDMGRAVTGGGLMFKDCSKADVSINIYCYLKAQELGRPYELSCAIGDEFVDGRPYEEIVKIAKDYIDSLGGFEKFAEWGLIR